MQESLYTNNNQSTMGKNVLPINQSINNYSYMKVKLFYERKSLLYTVGHLVYLLHTMVGERHVPVINLLL